MDDVRAENERLKRDLKDWQDSSEAFRADARRLAASLREAIAYADAAAEAEGMPAGKQCKRLSAMSVGCDSSDIDVVVFDVAGARVILADTERALSASGEGATE